jgi:hypothetical protein
MTQQEWDALEGWEIRLVKLAPEDGGFWHATIPQLGEGTFVGDGETKEAALADLESRRRHLFSLCSVTSRSEQGAITVNDENLPAPGWSERPGLVDEVAHLRQKVGDLMSDARLAAQRAESQRLLLAQALARTQAELAQMRETARLFLKQRLAHTAADWNLSTAPSFYADVWAMLMDDSDIIQTPFLPGLPEAQRSELLLLSRLADGWWDLSGYDQRFYFLSAWRSAYANYRDERRSEKEKGQEG